MSRPEEEMDITAQPKERSPLVPWTPGATGKGFLTKAKRLEIWEVDDRFAPHQHEALAALEVDPEEIETFLIICDGQLSLYGGADDVCRETVDEIARLDPRVPRASRSKFLFG